MKAATSLFVLLLAGCQVISEQDFWEWRRVNEEAREEAKTATAVTQSLDVRLGAVEAVAEKMTTEVAAFREEFRTSLTAAIVEERVRDRHELVKLTATLDSIQAEISAVKEDGGVVTGNELAATETELERAVAAKIRNMGMLTFLGFAAFLVFVFRERLGRLIGRKVGRNADE